MGQYYVSLLTSAWHSTLALGSSTGYSMLVLNVLAAILISVVTLGVEWWRGGHSVSSFSAVWKQWPTYVVPSIIIILLWAGTFAWSLLVAPYSDHMNLVASLNATELEANHWKIEAKRIPVPAPSLPIVGTPAGKQWRWESITRKAMGEAKPGVTALITALGEVKSLNFAVKCSVPCKFESAMVSGIYSGTWPEQLAPIPEEPNVVRMRIVAPAQLNRGNQLSLYFSSLDDQSLDLDWVHTFASSNGNGSAKHRAEPTKVSK